ncbi:MAG: hypothetical protein N3A69_01265 [Leptospiraceae bacterium]|nr:hypothetical protein [Leptospiraceae bacterium]
MYKGIPANSATSPLNVLLLSLVTFFIQDPENSVLALNLLWLSILYFQLSKIRTLLGLHFLFTPIAASLLILNPFLFSSAGLESIALVVLFVWFVRVFLEKKYFLLGIFLGLLYLTRPDGILLAFPFLIFLGNRPLEFLKVIFSSAFIVLPWMSFSYFYFGSLIPDTLLIKKTQTWETFNFGNGLILYFHRYPLELFILIFSIVLLVTLAFSKISFQLNLTQRLAIFILFSALLHYIAYSLLSVPPYHWYYTPSLSALLLGLSIKAFSFRKKAKIIFATGFYLVFIFYTAIVYWFSFQKKEMPIHTNWTSRDNYKDLALKLDSLSSNLTYYQTAGEIGTLAYFSKKAILVDIFSSRLRIESVCKGLVLDQNFHLLRYLTCTNLSKMKENNQALKNISFKSLIAYLEKPKNEDSSEIILGPLKSKWIASFYVVVK